MANSTAETIINRAWKKLRKDGNSTDVPALQQDEMLASLNDISNEWRRAFRMGSGEPPAVMRKEKGYDLVADTDLNGAITTASTSVIVDDATNLDTSGAIAVWDDDMPDIIEYTGKSSNTLTGVTGIDWSHEDEDVVCKLYALPSNFGSFRATEDSPEGVMVSRIPYRFTSGIPIAFQFALYDNGTTKYLMFPRGVTGSVFLTYNKTSSTIDSIDDLMEWPNEYDPFGVWRLVEYSTVGDTLDPNLIAYAKREGNRILQQALNDRNVGKFARPRPIRLLGNIYRDPTLYQRVPR